MRLDPFLGVADVQRVISVLRKLNTCGLDYAITGGIALEPSLGSGLSRQRALNDIDIVVSTFEALLSTLASAFMISHAHPDRPTGKLAIQLVEPNQRVRVDVFSARGDTLAQHAIRRSWEARLPYLEANAMDKSCALSRRAAI